MMAFLRKRDFGEIMKIKEILRLHALWVESSPEGEQANLQGVNLQEVNLQGVDISWVNLREANLRRADLFRANLRGASLYKANLHRADLREANLRGVDFFRADLNMANLERANLHMAYFSGADLRGAYFYGATLNWSSHDLIAELLSREMGNDLEQRQLTGLILISKNWCWNDFLKLKHPAQDWALSVLAKYIQPYDAAPLILRSRL
jgi:hypothetical protein